MLQLAALFFVWVALVACSSKADHISSLLPQHGAILFPGVVTISATFAQQETEVKKAKVELWRYSNDDKKKHDKQKLEMKVDDNDVNRYSVESKSSLDEEGAYCYTVEVEFKSGKNKKFKSDANCFIILVQEAATQEPSSSPTHIPSSAPTPSPSGTVLSAQPITAGPSYSPTSNPSQIPTQAQTKSPTNGPSSAPTEVPTTTLTLSAAAVSRVKFKVEVKWKADGYAKEFAYQLSDSEGNIVLEKKRSNEKKGSTKGEVESGKTYCFRGTDDWGDGICCGEGNGGYELKVNGKKLIKGGIFRFSTGYLCFTVDEEGEADMVAPPTTPFCEANDPERFNICMEIVDVSNGKLEEDGLAKDFSGAFVRAKEKWTNVLKDDDGTEHDMLGFLVDDVYIEAAAASIDGKGTANGNILGFAGTGLTWKTDDGFTKAFSGYMAFDIVDLPEMITEDTLKSVVNHEILHVLGLGTLWDENGLYQNGGAYKGEHANEAYRNILLASGASFDVSQVTLPIEQDGGSGTAHAHFDEDCLDHEISTGWVDNNSVLSNITIACLHDLGLSVNFNVAEPYMIPDLSICPGSRRLRNRERKTRHRWRQLTGEPTAKDLDFRVVDYATHAGQEFLAASKSKGLGLPKGVVDYGSRLVDVLFFDRNSSNIFSILVHENG